MLVSMLSFPSTWVSFTKKMDPLQEKTSIRE
jgi:hypothetical protein